MRVASRDLCGALGAEVARRDLLLTDGSARLEMDLWNPLFSGEPPHFPKGSIIVCKWLWKMVFERHRQSPPQSGSVHAMRIGKVQPSANSGRRRCKKKEGGKSMKEQTVRLGPREQQIVELLLQGCDNAEIASQLKMARRTVKAHFNRLFLRFGITGGIKRVKLRPCYIGGKHVCKRTLWDPCPQ